MHESTHKLNGQPLMPLTPSAGAKNVKGITYDRTRYYQHVHYQCPLHYARSTHSTVRISAIQCWSVYFNLVTESAKLNITDVNETRESQVSIFFLNPGKGNSRLPRIETSDCPTIGPICERDNCHWSLCACFTVAVAHIPDAQTPQNKKQWRI